MSENVSIVAANLAPSTTSREQNATDTMISDVCSCPCLFDPSQHIDSDVNIRLMLAPTVIAAAVAFTVIAYNMVSAYSNDHGIGDAAAASINDMFIILALGVLVSFGVRCFQDYRTAENASNNNDRISNSQSVNAVSVIAVTVNVPIISDASRDLSWCDFFRMLFSARTERHTVYPTLNGHFVQYNITRAELVQSQPENSPLLNQWPTYGSIQ